MKTLVFIVCLLAMANGSMDDLKQYLTECSKNLKQPIPTDLTKISEDFFYCLCNKFHVIDNKGRLMIDKCIKLSPIYFPDCCNRVKALELYFKCFYDIYAAKKYNYTNETMNGLKCLKPVMALLPKIPTHCSCI